MSGGPFSYGETAALRVGGMVALDLRCLCGATWSAVARANADVLDPTRCAPALPVTADPACPQCGAAEAVAAVIRR